MLESLDEGVHGGEGGVAGDMTRGGFSHEEAFTLSYKFFTKPVWLKSAKGGEAGERPLDRRHGHNLDHGHMGPSHTFTA